MQNDIECRANAVRNNTVILYNNKLFTINYYCDAYIELCDWMMLSIIYKHADQLQDTLYLAIAMVQSRTPINGTFSGDIVKIYSGLAIIILIIM